jgi:hypothetical protein
MVPSWRSAFAAVGPLPLLLLLLPLLASAQHLTAADRFAGFRFEIKGQPKTFAAVLDHVEKAGADLSCFGWVQRSPIDSVVGEARCNKEAGELLSHYLHRGLAAHYESFEQAIVHPYSDTNIKLHFSSFKQLPVERQTCFNEPPHACADYANAAGATASAAKTEL